MQTSTQNTTANRIFRKKSRRLTRPDLKPSVLQHTGGYLPIPLELIGCAKYGLTVAHLGVLLYLLAKPAFTTNGEPWRVNYTHMADQLGIGETYAPKYVTALHEKGFLDFVRNDKGETDWIVKLPEHFFTTPSAAIADPIAPAAINPEPEKTPVAAEQTPEPQRQNIHVDNIHVEIVAPLYINKLVDITKETTTAVVEEAAVNEVFVQLPVELDCADVKQQLKKLSRDQQELTLAVWFSYVASLKAKNEPFSPIATLKGLAKKALQGTLNPIKKTAEKPLSPLEKEKQTKQKLFDFFKSNLDKLKHDFLELKKDYVHAPGLGNITHYHFSEYMAVYGAAA